MHAFRVQVPLIFCGFFREIYTCFSLLYVTRRARYRGLRWVKVESSVSTLILSHRSTRCALLHHRYPRTQCVRNFQSYLSFVMLKAVYMQFKLRMMYPIICDVSHCAIYQHKERSVIQFDIAKYPLVFFRTVASMSTFMHLYIVFVYNCLLYRYNGLLIRYNGLNPLPGSMFKNSLAHPHAVENVMWF